MSTLPHLAPGELRPGDRVLLRGAWHTVLGVADEGHGRVEILTEDTADPWIIDAAAQVTADVKPTVPAGALLAAAWFAVEDMRRGPVVAWHVYSRGPSGRSVLLGTAATPTARDALLKGARGTAVAVPIHGSGR